MVGRKHAFTYDHQGNRLTHSRNSHTTTYTTNNLNQYTARTNHGYLLVEGTSGNATVKVYETGSTEETATRKNDYYFRDWDPNTSSTASDYPEINVKEGTTVSATKNAWIPGVSETPITYDNNGNLTADALWTYTYDEENRLIGMAETAAAATAGFPDTTITFKYDYLGRRVEKKVVRGTVTESHLRFVWRGWLLARISPKSSTALRNVGTGPGIVRCAELQGVDPASSAPPLETRSSTRPPFARYEFCEISGPVAELNAASDNARVKTYTWGPDVTGSLGGAGGNGGVLIFKDHTSTVNESFYPAYDARGNVTGLIDTAGNLDAAYEYDPFGKLIRYAGARSASMSLLYGTKYTDMETGLIYYGHRYYDPRQGRFINRDPIAEEGGINLYGFVGNNPVNRLDFLGLCESEGDTNEYGEEICSEHALQPFVIDGTPTDEDLMIWARQDEETERLIEELNSQDLNLQSNVDPENDSLWNNEYVKKRPPEKEELPPCSELKAKFESGEYKPTLTSESFIRDSEVSAGPFGLFGFETFHGDDRGFLDSPSDGSPGRTSRISATVEYDDSTFTPSPSIRIDRSTRTRWWGETSISERGSASIRRGYSVSTGTGASLGLEYRGSNPLAPRVLLPTTQNFNEIRMEAAVNVDFTTGMLNGSYSRSAYPAAQLFFDGKPIANLPASKLGPNALMGPNESGQINGIQICDPSK